MPVLSLGFVQARALFKKATDMLDKLNKWLGPKLPDAPMEAFFQDVANGKVGGVRIRHIDF
jgi:hypothetical protein